MTGGEKTRILFVCGGNTCRSPMAAAIANARYPDVLLAENAGTAAWEDSANEAAVHVLRDRFGIDLSGHRPRGIETIDIEGFDLVIAMDRSVASDLPDCRAQIEVWDVDDPYSRGVTAYEDAAARILEEIDKLARRLREALDQMRKQC